MTKSTLARELYPRLFRAGQRGGMDEATLADRILGVVEHDHGKAAGIALGTYSPTSLELALLAEAVEGTVEELLFGEDWHARWEFVTSILEGVQADRERLREDLRTRSTLADGVLREIPDDGSILDEAQSRAVREALVRIAGVR